MTLEEAKTAARDAGIPEEDLTPEVLQRFAWEPADVLKDIKPDPAQTSDQVLTDLALLEDERKANNLPANVAKIVGRVIPGIVSLI